MKSLLDLAESLLFDIGEACTVRTENDWKTIVRRTDTEGISFLTITLSDWAKGLERSLDQRLLSRTFFPTCRWRKGLPVFLRGFLEKVFSSTDGALLDSPCIVTIRCLRQFLLAFGKIRQPCSPKREQQGLCAYIQTEKEVADHDKYLEAHSMLSHRKMGYKSDFSRLSVLLWSELFSKVEKDLENSFRPGHGPGVTSDRRNGNSKWDFQEWSDRLEREFPFVEWALPNYRLFIKAQSVNFLPVGQERPVRVLSVPKTARTPRIIACEPSYVMYVQQGLLRIFQTQMEACWPSSHFCSFSSQQPNQRLAREGSETGDLATLDLSEASDRVSNQLVEDLFYAFPSLSKAVQASRSPQADVLGQLLSLSKFASMGSALTFPIESLVFTTLVFLGIEKALGHRLTLASIRSFRGKVRVYGDDILVPTDMVPSVCRALEAYGLKVNTNKSFWTGQFRESCGADWYSGYDVTVARIRSEIPTQRRHASEIASYSAFANQLRAIGSYPRTVAAVDSHLQKLIPYPWVRADSGAIGRVDPFDQSHIDVDRNCPMLHRPLVRGVRIHGTVPSSKFLDGWATLLAFFLKGSERPLQEGWTEHAGRPRSVRLITRWIPA